MTASTPTPLLPNDGALLLDIDSSDISFSDSLSGSEDTSDTSDVDAVLVSKSVARRVSKKVKVDALKAGDRVTTPYGAGVVLGVRESDNTVIVQPSTWMMDRGQKATFFMNPKDVKLSRVLS